MIGLVCHISGLKPELIELELVFLTKNWFFILTNLGSMGRDMEPQFVGLVHNVTVVVGREAILSCQVTKLRDFKVGWIKADQTILTLHKRVITHNNRIHITHDMHNTWDLHIK